MRHPFRPGALVMLAGMAGLLVWSGYAGGVEFVRLERMKLVVVAAAVVVVGCRSLRLAGMADRRLYLASLSLIACAAWVLYSNFFAFHGIGRERIFIHLHDVAHYYLGAKYFPELGYQRLYTAMLRAEAERYENHFRSLEVRDLESNGLVDIRALLARSDAVKARFSAERWAAFQADLAFFRDWMKEQWGEVLRDHGFNPPPLWPLLGGALANLVPAGSHAGILALTLLDPVLLIAMFASIAWAFGVEAMLLASIYFCTISGASFGWTGGGFLRFVWLASLVGAVCCLKRGGFATAGALLGLAAMLRIFPAWFVVPIALHALMDAIRRRQVSSRHVRFLLAFAGACASLFAATLALPAGLDHWQDFRRNMQRQVESNAYNSIGLNEILSFTGPVKASNAEEFARELDWRRKVYRVQIAVVVLAIIAWLARRPRWLDDTAATVLAIPLLFCTLSLAAYYYAFLILLVLAHGQSAWRIASLFGIELATGVLGMLESNPVVLFFYRNVLVAALLLGLYLSALPVAWSYPRRRSA